MSENIMGFIIWTIVGCIFIGIGIADYFCKKPVGLWANIKVVNVSDIKAYNMAVGRLFIVFGVIFTLLGLPLLFDENSPYILLSIVGVMFEAIIVMAVYSLYITKKYGAKFI